MQPTDLDLKPASRPASRPSRVITVSPMPPEKIAYALARYSRSPDSIRQSIDWVRSHNSSKFLESFYFQYGHASIADLGHTIVCFEGISELAATEIEDEQLWDGQARSSRYQDFSKCGLVTPPELSAAQAVVYQETGARLLHAYQAVHRAMRDYLVETLPRPEDMKVEAYERNLTARAFDVARYLLPFGIPTGVGQVVSIRTLERQIRRLKASAYGELRELGDEIASSCAAPPECVWPEDLSAEPIAPTLARHVSADTSVNASRARLAEWAKSNMSGIAPAEVPDVDLLRPTHKPAEVVATLLYPVVQLPFRQLFDLAASWSSSRRAEVLDLSLQSRTSRDEFVREFRTCDFSYDIIMDIGAYRDLHRHRRTQQFRQEYGAGLGCDTPEAVRMCGAEDIYSDSLNGALASFRSLPAPARDYILPLAARSRFLFKMDFAEAAYISQLRSGVKGHFSYRKIAWEMKECMERLEPELGRVMTATEPSVEDLLKR